MRIEKCKGKCFRAVHSSNANSSRIIVMMLNLELKKEESKIILVVMLVILVCSLTYYNHAVLRSGTVFTHFFYIPIILSSVWWQKKGVVVALFLSAMLIASHLFLRLDAETSNDFYRAPMFLLVSIVVAVLSERLKKEEKIARAGEQRFRSLIESSLTGFSIIQDGTVVYQNREQQKLLGPLPRPPKFTDIEHVHPDDIEKVTAFYRSMASKNFTTGETDFRFYQEDTTVGKPHMRWVHCRAVAIDYQGREAILVNMMDITKTKEMEHLLRIQDKMTALGRVTAGIAHEIRNPLSGINLYLNTLEKIYDKEGNADTVKRIIEQLQSASHRIKSVIKRVMDFSKPTHPKFFLIDINQPIEEAYKLSSVTLRKSGVAIEKCLADNLPLTLADPRMIEEVILNLMTNAAEALHQVDGLKIIEMISSKEDSNLLISVADSGPGIPQNLMSHIFDPFYTTKNGGTGIGLSICHRIIKDHGGSLSITVSKWGGAEFVIKLPLKEV